MGGIMEPENIRGNSLTSGLWAAKLYVDDLRRMKPKILSKGVRLLGADILQTGMYPIVSRKVTGGILTQSRISPE